VFFFCFIHLEKGTFISNGLDSRSEEYYLGTTTWSTNTDDWELRIGAGGIVNDPQGEWDYSTAEAYINEKVAEINDDLAAETLARQNGDSGLQNSINQLSSQVVKTVTQSLTTAQKDIANANLENKDATNGMARVVLKATDNFKTVVEGQTGGNTIFVIRYDYTLTGNVTIPTNCVIDFDGGSISGAYTITGTNTGIQAGIITVFGSNVILAGTWSNTQFNVKWLTSSDDISSALAKIVSIGKNIYIPEGIYNNTGMVGVTSNISIKGDGYGKTIISNLVTNTFNIVGNNVKVEGLSIIGAGKENNEVNFVDQHGICIDDYSNNVFISNCKFSKTVSGIFVGRECKSINISECIFETMYTHAPNNNGGYGIVFGHDDDPINPRMSVTDASITNNLFYHVTRHEMYLQSSKNIIIKGNRIYRDPNARSIDEYNAFNSISLRGCENLIIDDNICVGAATFFCNTTSTLYPHLKNFTIVNNYIKDSYGLDGWNYCAITMNYMQNSIIANNVFEDCVGCVRYSGDLLGLNVVSNNICRYKKNDAIKNQCFMFSSEITDNDGELTIKNNEIDIVNSGTGTQFEGTIFIGGSTLKTLNISGNNVRSNAYAGIYLHNIVVEKEVRVQNNSSIKMIVCDEITGNTKITYITDNVANNILTQQAASNYIVRDNVITDIS